MLGQVAVIGCGLIGGSLVKALRSRGNAARVGAVDREEVLAAAASYLDEGASMGSPEAVRLVARSDLVVLAMPIGGILRDLAWVLDAVAPHAVVTDTGSVKKPIIEAAAQSAHLERFVGGHPMAGREVGGFEASTADLFEKARWFLVTSEGATGELEKRSLGRAMELAQAVGARPVVIDAETHDRAMAYVSHAPQLMASALFGVAARAGVLGEAGPGFRDATRISGGPPAIWRDILEANRRQIALALGDILAPLVRLRDTLADGGEKAMALAVELLEEAQVAKSASPSIPPGARGPGS